MPHVCIGRVADPCLEKPENQSTHAMVACTDQETKIWDACSMPSTSDCCCGRGKGRGRHRQGAASWIGLRDADCAIPYELFDGGTMSQPISANCVLAHTADRA